MNGQVCVVTGATSGIGLETARGLAHLGAHVVLTARTAEKGDAAVADIRASNPGVFPFGPFWSTWRTLRRSILGPKRPRRSFPSAVKYLDSESMTPSTVIRPRFVSVQVPEVADFAFCPIVGRATAVAYNKIW